MINLTTDRPGTEPLKKLLLIEDDISVVESLNLLLKTDYEIHSESTIASGIRCFRNLRPSLVVLDLRLPDGEGLEFLREMRLSDTHTPVVVLTGYACLRTVEESLRLGASDYLHKPFDGFALKSRIDQLLPSPSTGEAKPNEQPDSENSAATQRQIATLELKARASAMFLHDISSPMTTALTCAHYLCEQIEENHSPDSDTQEVIELLTNAMGFLAGLFEQSGSIESLRLLPHSPVKVSKVVNLAASLVESKAKHHKVTVALQVQKPDAMINVNRFALARVLMNLVHNAIEAVQPETGRVTLTADCSDGLVEFFVRDNGPGIAADIRERVFEPNFTTKATGSGLGLYISGHLVASMGGELTLASESGTGCCFSIKLPVIL